MAAKDGNRFKFTAETLASVKCPPSGRPDRSGRRYVYDTHQVGLAFCVTEGGARNFYFCQRLKDGRYIRMKLGAVEDWNILRARERASELRSAVNDNKNPQAERIAKREEATFGDLWESYLEGHAKQHKRPKSVAADERMYAVHLRQWAGRRITEITTADVDLLKSRVGKKTPIQANRLLALLSTMFHKRGHLFGVPAHASPTIGVERYKERARTRVLTSDEISRLLATLKLEPNETVRDFFYLLLYTGARKSNVAGMRWEDLNLRQGTWKIPGATTKNGDDILVPLVPEAVAVLEKRPDASPYVFPARRLTREQQDRAKALAASGTATRAIAKALGVSQTGAMRLLDPTFVAAPQDGPLTGVSKAWERIRKAAGITEHANLHDFRRTFCTALIEAGVSLPYASAALAHRTIATTQKHYAMARADKLRESVQAGITGMLAGATKAAEEAKKVAAKAAG